MYFFAVYPISYELDIIPTSEYGSSSNGSCSELAFSDRICDAPCSSVLFDDIVPTLTGLNGDTWARQLLAVTTTTSIFQVTVEFAGQTGNDGMSDDNFIRSIIVILLNCPLRGIGASSISVQDIHAEDPIISIQYPAII